MASLPGLFNNTYSATRFITCLALIISLCSISTIAAASDFSGAKTTVACPAISANPVVGNIFEYTFKAYDADGKVYAGTTLPGVSVVTALTDYSPNYVKPPAADSGNFIGSLLYDKSAADGTFRVQLVTTIAGTYTIKLSKDGAQFGPTCAITFDPADIASLAFTPATKGTINNPLVAGIQKTLSLVSFDKYGNPAPLTAAAFNPPGFSITKDFFASKTLTGDSKTLKIVNSGDGQVVNIELTPYFTGTGTLTITMIGKSFSPFTGPKENIFTIGAGNNADLKYIGNITLNFL